MEFNFKIDECDEKAGPCGTLSIGYNNVFNVVKRFTPFLDVHSGKVDFSSDVNIDNCRMLKNFVKKKIHIYNFHNLNANDLMIVSENKLTLMADEHDGVQMDLILNEEERIKFYETLMKIVDWCEELMQ